MPGNCDFVANNNNLIPTEEVESAKIVVNGAKSRVLTKENKVTTSKKTKEKTGAEKIEKINTKVQEQVSAVEVEEKNVPIPAEGVERTDGDAEEKQPVLFENPFVTLDQSIEKGKNILKSIENIIVSLYEEYFENRGFSYTKAEILVNLQEYLQSLLLVFATANKEIREEEIRFIWSVMSRADIFTGSKGMEECLQKAQIAVKNTPYGLLIAVAVDKVYGKKETQIILSDIYNLYLTMCLLVGEKPISKGKLLENLIAFAKTQGVKIT